MDMGFILGNIYRTLLNYKKGPTSTLKGPFKADIASSSCEWRFLVVEPGQIIFLMQNTIPLNEAIILVYVGDYSLNETPLMER